LIQGVIDAMCNFSDQDYGWARSIHDWTIFQKIDVGNPCDEEQILAL
jgi:hypothetical protein